MKAQTKHWTIRLLKWYLDVEYWFLVFIAAVILVAVVFTNIVRLIYSNDAGKYTWTYSDVRIVSEKKDKALSPTLFHSQNESLKILKTEETKIHNVLEVDFGSFQKTTQSSLFWLTMLRFISCAALIVFQVIFMRKFFTNMVHTEKIFSVENLLLLKKSAILCIFYSFIDSIFGTLIDTQLTKYIEMKGYVFSTEWLFEDLFWGIFVYAIAEIFRYGLEIQQENELTI